MGDHRPMRPCPEIHIDLRTESERAEVPGASLVNHDLPKVIEIWNLVFMQYNRKADGTLEPLPAKVIDTGMGFERLRAWRFKGNVQTTIPMYSPSDKQDRLTQRQKLRQNHKADIAMRVVADHVRTIAFSIADSQLPSNAKAGYVIRRILRRAVRLAYVLDPETGVRVPPCGHF